MCHVPSIKGDDQNNSSLLDSMVSLSNPIQWFVSGNVEMVHLLHNSDHHELYLIVRKDQSKN